MFVQCLTGLGRSTYCGQHLWGSFQTVPCQSQGLALVCPLIKFKGLFGSNLKPRNSEKYETTLWGLEGHKLWQVKDKRWPLQVPPTFFRVVSYWVCSWTAFMRECPECLLNILWPFWVSNLPGRCLEFWTCKLSSRLRCLKPIWTLLQLLSEALEVHFDKRAGALLHKPLRQMCRSKKHNTTVKRLLKTGPNLLFSKVYSSRLN